MHSVRREVRLVRVDVWRVPVRLRTMGRMSIYVSSQWLRRALAKGMYLFFISCAV
jgi:hypothetical protein